MTEGDPASASIAPDSPNEERQKERSSAKKAKSKVDRGAKRKKGSASKGGESTPTPDEGPPPPFTAVEHGAYGGALRTPIRSLGDHVELYFSTKPLPARQPVLVFQHLRKTAGTATRRLMAANFKVQGHRSLYHYSPVADLPEKSIEDWWAEWHKALSKKEKQSLVAVACHTANYLLAHLERPARAFTILRDPVDRVLSRYYFYGSPRELSIKEMYERPGEKNKPEFYNGQVRGLLAPHYDVSELDRSIGPGRDADLWRGRAVALLADRYMVGVHERLGAAVQLFAEEFGWRRLELPSVRVNEKERGLDMDDATYELITQANWLDIELHEYYTKAFAAAPQAGSLDEGERSGELAKGLWYKRERESAASPRTIEGLEAELERTRAQLELVELTSTLRLGALERRLRAVERPDEAVTPKPVKKKTDR